MNLKFAYVKKIILKNLFYASCFTIPFQVVFVHFLISHLKI
jgi:hypothetical protein